MALHVLQLISHSMKLTLERYKRCHSNYYYYYYYYFMVASKCANTNRG